MAIVDHEAAWSELLALVVSRDGWGSKSLLAEAVKIAEKHRVPEDLVDRIIRIYGRDAVAAVIQGKVPSALGGTPTDERETAPPNEARGEHDGSQHQHQHHAHA